MILSYQGETHIQGTVAEIIFEFDEIMRIMIADHPDIVQASSLLYADKLFTAEVDGEHYALIEKVLRKKHEMQENDDYDDSRI